MVRKHVLILQHAPYEHPGTVIRALQTQRIPVKWVHVYKGEPIPMINEISGVVSLGGPMSANDEEDHAWISQELQLLEAAASKNLPLVGLCLGGQLIARALGARVERNKHPEIGWHEIQLTPDAVKDAIFGTIAPEAQFYHWHQDTFHLPTQAELLASSQACERQAYRVGRNIYGLQFHPEIDEDLVGAWLRAEGTHEDIETALMHPHPQARYSIQLGEVHEERAPQLVEHGAGLVAALSTLFIDETPGKKQEIAAGTRGEFVIQGERRRFAIGGVVLKVVHVAEIAGGISGGISFALVRSETGEIWPLRTDLILAIE